MHFEHLDCLVWPAGVLPFPLEVLIVNDRPLNLSTRDSGSADERRQPRRLGDLGQVGGNE
jgi:hypothetical protein